MKTLYTLLMLAIALQSAAQEIAGTVTDEKKDPLINALVQIYQGKTLKAGVITDIDGNYSAKPLEPGKYDVSVFYQGFDTLETKGVIVSSGQKNRLNFSLKRPDNGKALKEHVVVAYKVALVNPNGGGSHLITRENIARIPSTDIKDVASMAPAVYRQKRGRDANIGGARTSGTTYIIDGVVVQGTTGVGLSQNGVQSQFMNPSIPEYKKYPENDFMNVTANPLSTMSVDVDRASYTNIRRIINEGNKPPADAVRIEEMINYFSYDYPQPEDNNPISINTELTNCPWRQEHLLLRIGIQSVNSAKDEFPASNLVFLIDVSGSMQSAERLPLLKETMKLLVSNLRQKDMVSIVTYAGAAGLALPPTPGSNKQAILAALERLEAGGSTAGGAGIMLAYKTATDNFIKGGNNRVILATDGDFNVGVSSDNDLETLITKQRETGVFLTCLGVGTDNYKDAKLEMLADKGNGNYHYIDNIKEGQKAVVSEFGGTLFTVAKDVKAQIEFNPNKVQGYRLVGYENRLLNEEDFKDDKKDAGDMGAGHTVTILYEVIPTGIHSKFLRGTNKLKYRKQETTDKYESEFATVRFRYKQPDGNKSKEKAQTIDNTVLPWDDVSVNTKFATAVAMFGMQLKDSQFKGTTSYDDVLKAALANKGTDKDGYRDEFAQLVKAMKDYDARTSSK